MGRAVAAVSGFLHTASTCNSQEQSELFWSKDIASFLCSPGLTTGGDGRELLALGISHSCCKHQRDQPWGRREQD